MGKAKKPFYKRWWVWLIAIVLLWIIFAGADETEEEDVETADQEMVEDGEGQDVEDDKSVKEDEEKEEDSINEEDGASAVPNMNNIMDKSEQEVEGVLGEANSREETEFRLSGTEDRVPAITSTYQDGTVEVMFVEGTAQRVTYTPPQSIDYNENEIDQLLTDLHIDATITFENDFVTRGESENAHEVSINNNDGNIGFVYIVVDEKYQ
ncbi:hypothetical protein SAMN05216389_106109 [Oceanobacillus limi]|uniref:Uncharacterized protein n=1 Tax=Oceanobacillus limi TaxID=930131 RepID=A0A1I0C9R1_9BACI|nr:hypothetical protein [Oceanobacillus limi]SET16199.1 hypothetical protein SAMN05216389_106109 [Oceanobacillus limi]